ncbi:MAG: DUF4136 domain-containing protein [Pseudomonadota bacterium]
MTKWQRIVLGAAAAGLLSLAGCSTTPKVFSDYDPEQSFEGYQQFSWISDNPMTVSGDRGPNPITAARLKQAIQQEFERKGFEFVAKPADADFVVAWTVGARDRVDVRSRQYVDYYGPHWRWGYGYYGVRSVPSGTRTEVESREYTEGSLAIDVFDAARKAPVWHGSASKRLSEAELKGDSGEAIRNAVMRILEGFPPGAGAE